MVAGTKLCSPCLLEVMGKRVRVVGRVAGKKPMLPKLQTLLTSINSAISYLSLISVNRVFDFASSIYSQVTHIHTHNTLFDPEHCN